MYTYFLLLLISALGCPEASYITAEGRTTSRLIRFLLPTSDGPSENISIPYAEVFYVTITCDEDQNLNNIRTHFVKSLRNLKKITIYDCPLASIERWAFKGLPDLEHIDIQGNHYIPVVATPVLRKESFSDLQSVTDIDIKYLGIADIEEETFSNLPKLKHLDLSINKLTYFSEKWFANSAYNIEFIDLNLNSIKVIETGAFKNFLNLRNLHLRINQITTIGSNAFQDLTRLELVDLSSNKITVVPSDIFGNKQLKSTLNLSSNKINYLTDEFLNTTLKNGIKINLWANPLTCPCYEHIKNWVNINLVQVKIHPLMRLALPCIPDPESPYICEMTVKPELTKKYESFH